MGAKCCMPVRDDKPLVQRRKYANCAELSTHRNSRQSPPWSFRCDNRTHIEDIVDSPAYFSNHHTGTTSSDIKSRLNTESEALSDGGSPPDAFQTPNWEKYLTRSSAPRNSRVGAADQAIWSNSAPEEKDTIESQSTANASHSKPSSSTMRIDPSSSRNSSLPSSDSISSMKPHHSPGYPLSRQVSDSRIPTLESLNESSSDGRRSFMVSTIGSQGSGSFDGSFSELVAFPQRESWSCDIQTNVQPSLTSVSCDPQTCGLCSKLLEERASWKIQKLVPGNEIAVVAVLACGHVYHSECLESVTPEADKFEPSCPICTNGENSGLKLLTTKAGSEARNRISRRAVADIDVNRDCTLDGQKSTCRSGKGLRLGGSFSLKKSSFGRPFLRRHLSSGSRPSGPVIDSESTRKRGFWARYR